MQIDLGHGSSLNLQLNPWDEKAFSMPVSEVLDIHSAGEVLDLSALDKKNKELNVGLCLFRNSTSDQFAKKAFMDAGFYIAETSVVVEIQPKQIKKMDLFKIKKAEESHLSAITRIAKEDFQYSRFHEDPFIDQRLARLRYENWVQDLYHSGEILVLVNENGEVMGFFNTRIRNSEILLILGGISSELKGFGYYAFGSFMSFLKSSGYKLTGRLSAANIPMLNIYLQLGFNIKCSDFDYHKLYRNRDGMTS